MITASMKETIARADLEARTCVEASLTLHSSLPLPDYL
jgi:hypothetical protein